MFRNWDEYKNLERRRDRSGPLYLKCGVSQIFYWLIVYHHSDNPL